MDLLDTPVRLTWNFAADSSGSVQDCPELAQRIVDAGVFFVTLQGWPLLHPEIDAVTDCLSAGGCQLLLACNGTAAEATTLTRLSASVQQLLLDAAAFINVQPGIDARTGVDKASLKESLRDLRELGYDPSLMLTPLRDNLQLIPELLGFCRDEKVPRFKLPNANIGDSFREYSSDELPRYHDLEKFRRLWDELPQEQGELPALDIHDLFLWEIMAYGQSQARSEYGGCQAANSLGHVDPAGLVHPCAAWPQPLGCLATEALIDIWAGSARMAVREQIDRTPEGCRECSDVAVCFGGCRGLSQKLNQAAGGRDLMCAGPR